jgi:LAO/AO transport system kinase
VTRTTRETVLLCEAAGFDFVIVETVGVGQSETAVAGMVDFFLALMLPGAGDELQGIKRGLVELVDMLVINKADGDTEVAARLTATSYRNALHCMAARHPDWPVPVLTCSALTGAGISELWSMVEQRLATLRSNGVLVTSRMDQAQRWLDALLSEGLKQRFESDAAVTALMPSVRADLRAGAISPVEAAERLLAVRERNIARGMR